MNNIEKGDKGGECNRTVCENKNAQFYNKSTLKYYCPICARKINEHARHELNGENLCVLEE